MNAALPKVLGELSPDGGNLILGPSSHYAATMSTFKQSILDTCLPIGTALIDNLQKKALFPTVQSVVRDLNDLREEQKAHERMTEKYEGAVGRYAALSKGKDPNTSRDVSLQQRNLSFVFAP